MTSREPGSSPGRPSIVIRPPRLRSRRLRRLVAAGLVAVVWLASCGDDADDVVVDDPALEQLDGARDLWERAAIVEYGFTATRSCECPEQEAGPIRIHVRDGEVVGRSYLGTPTEAGPGAVEEIFDEIAGSIERGERVEVGYDPDSGFPTSVKLDLDSLPVDGGLSLTLESFVSYDLLREELAVARAAWEQSGFADYDATYRILCYCPEIIVTIEVRDGALARHRIEGAATTDFLETVEEMFADIEDAIDGAASAIDAAYHPELGYPVRVYVDELEFVFDEEHGFEVETLDPVDVDGS